MLDVDGKRTLTYTVTVDYILFMTRDVDVTPNPNEIRDYKYVSKEELQAMFDDPCAYYSHLS